MDDIWIAIAEDYETAKQCLWCPKACNWFRQEDKGRYHLWKAYYAATQAETKENLLYARILMMMNDEQYNAWEHDRFRKYVASAKEAYEVAIREGGKLPTAKEMEKVNSSTTTVRSASVAAWCTMLMCVFALLCGLIWNLNSSNLSS